MITFDTSTLLSYYQARSGLTGAAASGATPATASKVKVPSAPWLSGGTPPATELVRSALNGRKFVDEGASSTSLRGASPDYAKLFATYQALNTLSAIATRAGEKRVPDSEITRLQTAR